MKTIKLYCPAAATALSFTTEGESTTCLIKHGLVITSKGIEFPEYLLDSVMWRVGMAWEIPFYEERIFQSTDEINEMNALGRLKETLKKLGGVEKFEFDDADNYTGKAVVETVDETETQKTVAVSLTAQIAKNAYDFVMACDNGKDDELGAVLNGWQGGKMRLLGAHAQRLACVLYLLVVDYQSCGIEALSPKARLVYTRDAVAKQLVKVGLANELNWGK